MTIGTTIRLIIPGTIAAASQEPQVIVMPCWPANSAASGLPAIDVRNIALVEIDAWYVAIVTNAAVLLASELPSGPKDRARDCRIGKIAPPERAVWLGINGARTRSVAARL